MSTQNVSVLLPSDVTYVSGTVNGVEYTWTNIEGNRWEAVVERTESEIYVVVLTIINTLGTTTVENFTLYYGTLSLITDRTAQDVERWRYLHTKGWEAMSEEERDEWQTSLKGAYNYTDMNRVESAVQFIADRFLDLGYYVAPEVKMVWSVSDHPTKADMERYFANIALLRSILTVLPTTPQAPTTEKKLDYQVANDIEQILTDVDRLISSVKQGWYYAGDVFTGEI
jgi:hypothetical protein